MAGVLKGEQQEKGALAPKPRSFDEPGNGPSPNEPPVPALQKHGFNGGIGAFNDRVQKAVDAYRGSYGVQPPASLVFDLAKSPVHQDDFAHMFTVPLSQFAAKNRGIAVEHGYNPNAPIVTSAKQLANGILQSAQNGNYHDYISQHIDLIHQFTQGDSKAAAQIAGAVFKARRIEAFSSTKPGLSQAQLQQEGLAPTDTQLAHWATDATNIFGRAVSQVNESLVHAPAGIYELGRAAGLDMQAGFEHPESHHQLSHLKPIAKGMVKQTVQDVEHPGRNPGYLFLDILGVASPVVGGAARVGEAGSALRAGEGVGAAARALATKSLKRATVRYGDYSEQMPLSQNPIVSAFQQYVIDKRVAHADAKLAAPTAGTGFLQDNVARRFFDNQLSLPKKVSRLAEQRQRLDYTSMMHIKNELDAAAGHAYTEARKRGKIGVRFKGLSRGEQKAIQVLSWDDSDPLAAERRFHETMIATGFNEKFHQQQLADLELAKKVLDNPSERFKKSLALTKQVVTEMQMMKIKDLGLLPETAEGRIAKAGQALRGEELVGVTPSERVVANKFASQIAKNPEGAVDEYVRRFGNVINTDLARELSPDYAKSKESRSRLANAVHEPASSLSKEAYKRLLAQPKERDGLVHFTAGGTGAGKTRAIGDELAKSGDIVYDTNLNNFASSVDKIDQALESGRDVAIHYVYRSPVDSLVHGAIKRAKRMGRTVPLHEHVKTHVGSNDVIRQLVEKYAKDDRVQIHFLHNGKDGIVKIDFSQLPKLGYNEVANEVKAAYEAEHAAGRVPPAVHEGFSGQVHAGNDRELAAGTSRKPGHGSSLLSDESFYLPTKLRGKGNPKVPTSPVAIKAGQYGVPLPRSLPELNKEFGAKVIYDGNMRVDATHLASEAYARTVRAVTIRAEHQKLWDAALDTPDSIPEQFRMPIRDAQVIKDELRDAVSQLDEGWIDPKDAASLPEDSRTLLEELYPSMRHIDQIEGVKWFDSRLLTEGSKVPHIPGTAADVAQALNSPFRFIALFLRPAYILNKFGNAAMLAFDQGIHTVPNYIRALDGKNLYGAENMREIYDHVGAGRSRSYVASSSGRFSHAVADFWNRVADRDERAAAFIHYMRLKGYKTQEDVSRLLHDPEARADLNEVRDRANKSLVQFDNLLPIEKNFLRHLIFVYPWVSRSTVWSIRAIFEHPTKSAILSHLGREDLETDPIWKHAPAWFKRTGYIPLGWNGDGTVMVVNPTSVNTFSTLGDFLAFVKSSTVGDKYASAEDFLGPAAKFAIHGSTGRDEFGNQYPGSQWWGAAKEVLAGLPQVSAFDKAHPKAKKAGPSFNLSNRSSLAASINANLKKTVMSPGWLNGYGSLILGGFSPRDVNMPALEARYWADQNPDVRHKHELDLLNRALKIQADALGRSISPEVKDAVSVQSNLNYQYKVHLKNTGRAPTDKERAVFTLAFLKKDGRVPAALATKLSKQLATESDPTEINRITNSLLSKYGNGEALHQWDSDVRSLASFTPTIFNEKVGSLFSQGLADQRKYNVSQEKLYDYGRKYIAYKHEAKKLQNSGASSLELKAFEDAHDTPVDGLPSFPRIAWSEQTPASRQAHIASIVTQSWGSLSGFDKTILGRPTDPKVTQGWVTLNKIIDDQRKALAREGRTFPSGYARTLAKYVEKYYDAPGLVKDFDFSKQPEYQRLKYLRPIQDSPNKNLWAQVFNVAAGYSKYLHATDDTGQKAYSATQVRQMWKDYIRSKGFQSWLTEHPAFSAEIVSYGKGTLAGLIG